VFPRELTGKTIHGEASCTIAPRARGDGLSLRSALPAEPHVQHDAIAAAMEGLQDGAATGVDGLPLDDCEVVLTRLIVRAEANPLIGARAAAAEALRRAVASAGSTELEPIMRVEASVEPDHLGSVLGDLQQRHGQVQDVAEREHERVVTAFVPLRNLFGYATRLRSLSEGHGSFSMEFERYDTAPG
jgi:elongation factor G